MSFLSLFCLFNIAWIWQTPKDQEYMKKAAEAYKAGNLNEAITDYGIVLTIKPKNVDALNSLGVIYEELGFPDKAEEKYLTALNINMHFLPAYLNLGLLYWNRGDLERASYYFQQRVNFGRPHDPWTIKAQKALENIQAKTNPLPAKPSSVKAPPEDNKKRLDLINQELDKINTIKPKQVIEPKPQSASEGASNQDLQEAQVIFYQGQQLASQGRYQEAIDTYDRALQKIPGNPHVIKARVDAFLLMKQQQLSNQQ